MMALYFIVILLFMPVVISGQSVRDTVITTGVLREAVIVSNQMKLKPSEVGIRLDPLVLSKVPSIFGNKDIMKVVHYLPGVNNNSEGNVGVSVRGGDYDETFVSLDKIPLYNTGNLKGFISVFNPDIIGDTYFYKTAFPAEYGGRLSGVIDIHSKSVYGEKINGCISIGTMMSGASVSSKVNENTAFILSGRVSYLGLLVLPIYRKIISGSDESINFTTQVDGVEFYDMNGVVEHRFNNKHTIKGSIYSGNNINKLTNDIRKSTYIFEGSDITNWGNIGGSLLWNYNYSEKHQISSFLYFSRYSKRDRLYQKSVASTVFTDSVFQKSKIAEQSLRNNIADIAAGMEARFIAGIHTLDYGWKYSMQFAGFLSDIFNKEAEYKNSKESILYNERSESNLSYNLHTLSLYADDEFSIDNWLDVGIGSRFTIYANYGFVRMVPEPRIRLSIHPFTSTRDLSFKLSYSRMSQGVHQLIRGGAVLESDIWTLANDKIPVSTSNQYSGGIYWDIYPDNKKCSFSLEGYYTRAQNVVDYKEGVTYVKMDNIADIVDIGEGKSFGVEGSVIKEFGLTTWSVSYTWGKSLDRYNSKNNGMWFYSKQDIRHNLSTWISQKLGKHFDVSASFVYKSGRYITLEDMYLPIFVTPANSVVNIFIASGINNYKLGDYHKLDLSANYYIFHKLGKSTINISINNVYNHHNTYKLWLIELPNKQGYELRSLCLFPFMPSLSYSFEF